MDRSFESILADFGDIAIRLKGMYANENDIARIRDSIAGLRKKQVENEAAIKAMEPVVMEKIELRDKLVKHKSQIDALISTKATVSPLKTALMWLATEYPETTTMTFSQILEFIDIARIDITAKQDKIKDDIKKLCVDESKYNVLLKRRENYAEKIAEKEAAMEESILLSVSIKRDLNSAATLQRIASKLKDYIKDETSRQILLEHLTKEC